MIQHLVEAVDGIAPLALVHKVIPFRDQVVHRATRVGLTERRAAVHAACSLHCALYRIVARCGLDFLPVEYTLKRVAVRVRDTVVVHEATVLVDLGHRPITPLY